MLKPQKHSLRKKMLHAKIKIPEKPLPKITQYRFTANPRHNQEWQIIIITNKRRPQCWCHNFIQSSSLTKKLAMDDLFHLTVKIVFPYNCLQFLFWQELILSGAAVLFFLSFIHGEYQLAHSFPWLQITMCFGHLFQRIWSHFADFKGALFYPV